jgi:hypothetical protein
MPHLPAPLTKSTQHPQPEFGEGPAAKGAGPLMRKMFAAGLKPR